MQQRRLRRQQASKHEDTGTNGVNSCLKESGRINAPDTRAWASMVVLSPSALLVVLPAAVRCGSSSTEASAGSMGLESAAARWAGSRDGRGLPGTQPWGVAGAAALAPPHPRIKPSPASQ